MPSEAAYDAIIQEINTLGDTAKTAEAKKRCLAAIGRAEEAHDEAFVHCFRGQLAWLEGDYRRLLEEQSKAMRLSPRSALLKRELGWALCVEGRDKEALASFEAALGVNPEDLGALRGWATALSDTGQDQEALEAIDRALMIDPEDPASLRVRASTLDGLGRHEEALRSAEKSLSIQSDSLNALRCRAVVLGKLQRHEAAWECLEKASDLKRDDPHTLVTRGLLLMQQNKAEEALECVEGALKASPGWPSALRGRAVLLGLLGRKDEAVKDLRTLLEERADDERAKLWLFRFEEPEQARELEREQLQARRHQAQEAREREIRLDAWRKLSARTAHRVDNQLFAAKGAVRSLKAQAGPETADAAHDIDDSLDRIARICSEFRRFSTDQPPKPRSTDVHVLVQDTVRRYSKSVEGIDIDVQLAPLLPECRWDPQQIDQAISELLENAIRHTPKGKSIAVSAEPFARDGKHFVRIVVTNYGKGIDARYKGRLFEPFFSLRPGGTGLGLAIVSQMIKNHGGTIRETGDPGEFARFEIELPAQQGKEESA